MIEDFALRSEQAFLPERAFLERRVLEIEKGMGKVAARGGDGSTRISQPLDALDRAREITGGLMRQVRVRALDEAIAAQLAWLDRAEARAALADGEPKVRLDRIALDRRILNDLAQAWKARRN